MKKGRILTALCAALMCLFMLGACAGCDGEGGGGGKTEVDLIKDVIAEKCEYSYQESAGGFSQEGKMNTSDIVGGKAEYKAYEMFSFYTQIHDNFELNNVSFKFYSEYAYQVHVSLGIKDITDWPKNLYSDTKTFDLTDTEKQQGKELKWDLNKLSVKGSVSNRAVIVIFFSFYKDGEMVGPNMPYPGVFGEYDKELFATMNLSIGSLAMK